MHYRNQLSQDHREHATRWVMWLLSQTKAVDDYMIEL